MKKDAEIKELYSEIRKMLFYMIPEKWEKIYLYASVIQRENGEKTGEMFFYYFPKSLLKKNPTNVYEIPHKFSLDENEYLKLTSQLYELIKTLKDQCNKIDKIDWTNIRISVENVEFLVEYNNDDLVNSNYSPEDRRVIWQYKYLDYPIEKFTKEKRDVINKYLYEEKLGLHKIKKYVETFYEKHEYNNIQYDIAKEKEDTYVNTDDINLQFELISNDTYQIHNSHNKRKKEKANVQLDEKKKDEEEIVIRNQILKY